MSLRVVLYAEGAGDLGRHEGLPPAPGTELDPESLGPAHLLAARVLEAERGVPLPAVRFEAGLRVPRGGKIPRGSDFLIRDVLRRLLTWPRAEQRPELAIVLVDSDQELDRGDRIATYVSGLPVAPIIAIAVHEFEAWLIADPNAVRAAIGEPVDFAPGPEQLRPGEAKRRLSDATSRTQPVGGAYEARKTICQTLNLDVVASRCTAFARFRSAVGALGL